MTPTLDSSLSNTWQKHTNGLNHNNLISSSPAPCQQLSDHCTICHTTHPRPTGASSPASAKCCCDGNLWVSTHTHSLSLVTPNSKWHNTQSQDCPEASTHLRPSSPFFCCQSLANNFRLATAKQPENVAKPTACMQEWNQFLFEPTTRNNQLTCCLPCLPVCETGPTSTLPQVPSTAWWHR